MNAVTVLFPLAESGGAVVPIRPLILGVLTVGAVVLWTAADEGSRPQPR